MLSLSVCLLPLEKPHLQTISGESIVISLSTLILPHWRINGIKM